MESNQEQKYETPCEATLNHACKIAITEDKPILLDYWTDSCDNNVIIGVRENNEKLLVKSEQEYTSPIQKIFKVENNYLILTENSIYLISCNVQTKRIS